jgi:Ca2+-binding RTX toxin-like protein
MGILAVIAAMVPSAAAADQSVTTSVRTVHARSASAAAPGNLLTISDDTGIENRISARTDSTGRLVLTAPEGLRDPDGPGPDCMLDNAKAGDETSTQVGCAAGYISAIVGTLGRGNDVFDADPGLTVMVGTEANGLQRPLSGGPGRDRLVGGAASDLLDGGGGPDSMAGGAGDDFVIGGPAADTVGGGLGADSLFGLGGPDRLNGGPDQDLCRGGGDVDVARLCELARGIP